ncbi:MAG: hypothetical protein ACOYLI_05480 [Synechococcus lacustris]
MALVSIPTRAAGIMIILVMVDATGAARSGTLPIAIGRSLGQQRQGKCDQQQAEGNKTAKALKAGHG